MDTSTLNDKTEFDMFFDANIDVFDSMTNFFDLNQLENLETNMYNSNVDLLFEQNNLSHMTPSSIDSSPKSNSNSGSDLESSVISASSPENLLQNNELNFLNEEQQAILIQHSENVEPITFVLPDTVENGIKFTNEIILNFDDQMDEKKLLEKCQYFSKMDVHEHLSVISSSPNDTCIDLKCDMIPNEEDDSNDDEEDESSDHKNKNKIKNTRSKNIVLTEEEKNVFIKEGYKVPIHFPLTKNEEKILKLVRRKIRNKRSAHISRLRKKDYIDGLETRVDKVTKENEELHKQIKLLQSQNSNLVKKLQDMQSCISAVFNKHKKSSTAILFVSLFITLSVYPFLDLNSNKFDSSLTAAMPYTTHSRTLLSNDYNLSDLAVNTIVKSSDSYDYIWDYYKKRNEI